MSVGAQIRECLKVAVPGGLPRGARPYGVLESLRGLVAPGSGCRVYVIPERLGAEVALSQSHLVEPSCVEFVETHKGVKFE